MAPFYLKVFSPPCSMTDAVRHNRGIIMIGLSIASVLIMAAGFKVSLYLYDK